MAQLLPALLVVQCCAAWPVPAERARPFTADRFRGHVSYLASDGLGGREVGTTGSARAAAYIARQFRALGLAPLGPNKDGLQTFQLDDGTPAANVLAVLPGRGDLTGQALLVTAHYDHCGTHPEQVAPGADAIFNGADDNASGVAAILLIAEELTTRRESLPASHRTIVFVAFDAEERGLRGARHYADHPPWPLEATSAVLNFDMVGRLRGGKLYVGDAPSCQRFSDILRDIEQRSGLTIEARFGGIARSDQAVFLERKIPAVHFNTGLFAEYHRPDDEVDRVDAEGGAQIAEIGALVARGLIAEAGPLPFRALDPVHDVQQAIALIGRLGIVPNVRAQDGRGPQVLLVRPGSLAADCGIRPGDHLKAVNGLSVARLEDAVALVPNLRFDRDMRVRLLRAGEPVEVTLPADRLMPLASPSAPNRAGVPAQ
jgi:hypothetical protein